VKRRLSSSTTFFWKLFPILWVSPFVIGMIRFIWGWLTLPDGAKSPFADFNPLILLFPILGGAFGFWMLGGLKSVYLNSDCLLVSNYLKRIEIPLSNIEYVSKPENSSHRRITIYLRSPSEFGDKIIFMPPFFMGEEIVEELRNRLGIRREKLVDSPLGNAQLLHIKRYLNLLKGKRSK
jgi:hypothetical protein